MRYLSVYNKLKMTNKELIYQYATTGQIIPKYQFNKLPNNTKKSYIKQRVIAAKQDHKFYIKDYELFGLQINDAQNIANSLIDENLVLLIQQTENINLLFNITKDNGLDRFKKMCGAPDFVIHNNINFFIKVLKNKKEPEKIINVFSETERHKLATYLIKSEFFYDIIDETLEPIKIFDELGILSTVTRRIGDLSNDSIIEFTKRHQNSDDMIQLLYFQILSRNIKIDGYSLHRIYINSKNPQKIFQLLKLAPTSTSFTMDELRLLFSRSVNLKEYLILINSNSTEKIETNIKNRMDLYDMRRVLATVNSLENLDIFVNIMGEKLIYGMKDFTDTDWGFILEHQRMNDKIYNAILKFKKDYF